ncbi:MAG TPA: BtrH N-terminal domain-containing protein [Bacteroidales bacterium]|nr:BtrH N-terminal domain-containing protein [Bacteroidales bacterium]
MIKNFTHIHAAHCETGVLQGLLKHNGFNISEPMIFGCGSGLYFAYMPYIKRNSIPFISYRIMPGWLTNRFKKRFDIGIVRKKYRSKAEAMDDLDKLLMQNIPVGLFTNLFFIPYFPESYRFHFNNHNLIVYGKENGSYLVSDPILDVPSSISFDDLATARFAAGIRNLRGDLFYISSTSNSYDLQKIIPEAIHTSTRSMLTPLPLNGYRGIRYLSARVKKWPDKLGEKMSKRYMGNIIRMLEEVGTGGSGFRYMYAAFLQEAAMYYKKDLLLESSDKMTMAADTWREFAYHAAVICKTEQPPQDMFNAASDILVRCSETEEMVFRNLSKV